MLEFRTRLLANGVKAEHIYTFYYRCMQMQVCQVGHEVADIFADRLPGDHKPMAKGEQDQHYTRVSRWDAGIASHASRRSASRVLLLPLLGRCPALTRKPNLPRAQRLLFMQGGRGSQGDSACPVQRR